MLCHQLNSAVSNSRYKQLALTRGLILIHGLFRITKPSQFGILSVGNITAATQFTQEDIDNGLVHYQHGSAPEMEDNVAFTVAAENERRNGEVRRRSLWSFQSPCWVFAEI